MEEVNDMAEQTGSDRVSNDYLETLEKVKQQYEQYVEVSKLYELSTTQEAEKPYQCRPASREYPLTTDRFRLKPKIDYAMNREI